MGFRIEPRSHGLGGFQSGLLRCVDSPGGLGGDGQRRVLRRAFPGAVDAARPREGHLVLVLRDGVGVGFREQSDRHRVPRRPRREERRCFPRKRGGEPRRLGHRQTPHRSDHGRQRTLDAAPRARQRRQRRGQLRLSRLSRLFGGGGRHLERRRRVVRERQHQELLLFLLLGGTTRRRKGLGRPLEVVRRPEVSKEHAPGNRVRRGVGVEQRGGSVGGRVGQAQDVLVPL
mmetsp:Transcript_14120/g.46101  ORF Transcript_14120/g.46101 Transcript_14120/m.46101 type:complete len:230 (-) Transcript_14120:1045-1734(-)